MGKIELTYASGGAIAIDASAGTGKTYFISESVKILIGLGFDIKHLLIVTFTENAAQEIKHRIRSLLIQVKNDSTQNDELRQKFTSAVENFDQATITTIHGFMNGIISSEPLLFNLPVQVTVSNNDRRSITSTIYRYVEWLLHRSEHRELVTVLQSLPLFRSAGKPVQSFVTKFGDFVAKVLDKNYDDETIFLNDFAKYRLSKEALGDFYKELLEGSKTLFALLSQTIPRLEGLSKAEVKEVLGGNFNTNWTGRIKLISRVLRRSLDTEAPIYWFLHLAFEIGTGPLDKIAGFGGNANESCLHINLPSLFGQGDEQIFELELDSEEKLKTSMNILKTQAALLVCQKVREHMRAERARSGEVGFQDMTDLMFESINNEKIIDGLRNRFHVVLVDEFQDTDRKQFAVFEKAFLDHKKPKSMFLMVGDPKQSIYGFRGADQNVFNAAKQKILSRYNNILTLEHNYRAHEALINSVNALFGSASGFYSKLTEGASRWDFAPSQAPLPNTELVQKRELFGNELFENPFEIESFADTKSSPKIKALRFIGGEIINLAKKGIALSSICVLVDSNSNAQSVMRQLKKQAIPCKMRGKKSLESSSYVDFYVYLSRAIASTDDQSALTYLANFPLFSHDDPDDDIKPFIARARSAYVVAGMVGVAQLLTTEKEDLLESMPDKNRQMSDIWQVGSLLHNQGADGLLPVSQLGQVADRLKKALSKEDTDALFLEDMQEAVSIMTVHASKGLGFDIVFYYKPIMQAKYQKTAFKEYDIAVESSGEIELRQAISDHPDFENQAEHKFWLNNLNVSYVALTRAKIKQYFVVATKHPVGFDSLLGILIGKAPTKAEKSSGYSDSNESIIGSWFKQGPSLGREVFEATKTNQAGRVQIGANEEIIETLRRIHPKKRHPYSLSYSRISPTKEIDDKASSEGRVVSDQKLPKGTNFGLFVHKVIEDFDGFQLRAFSDEGQNEEHITKLAERFAIGAKIKDWLGDFKSQIRALLSLQLANAKTKLFDLMTRPGVKIKKELAFTAHLKPNVEYKEYQLLSDSPIGRDLGLTRDIRINSGFLNGVIDFAAFYDQTIVIIDWKTNLLSVDEESDLEAYMKPPHPSYKLQAYIYALALQRAFPEHKIAGVYYVFTRTPSVYELLPREDLLSDLERQLHMGPRDQHEEGLTWI